MQAHAFAHETVLLQEAVDAVFTRANGRYVDATYGRGGHSRALLAKLDGEGSLYAFDKDPQAIAHANAHAGAQVDTRFQIFHRGFRDIKHALAEQHLQAVTGVLFDLGISSPQIDDGSRGFSFRFDAPLDMRMDNSKGETAADWLARASEREIGEVLWNYGQERFAKQIAKAVVAKRAAGACPATTGALAALVAGEVRTREAGQDPATRTFQAIRIHLNAELEELQSALGQAIELLEPGGRLVVISFHSLEDRIVKRVFAEAAGKSDEVTDPRARSLPITGDIKPQLLRLMGKIKPSEAEQSANGRARSAIMRIAERTSTHMKVARASERDFRRAAARAGGR
jgi:16S rRNA (cytosine1402-N4)-methyltransferase